MTAKEVRDWEIARGVRVTCRAERKGSGDWCAMVEGPKVTTCGYDPDLSLAMRMAMHLYDAKIVSPEKTT